MGWGVVFCVIEQDVKLDIGDKDRVLFMEWVCVVQLYLSFNLKPYSIVNVLTSGSPVSGMSGCPV